MSFLNELRILLIDARIALRDVPGFDDDPLRPRLEQAIRDISEYVMPPPAASTKTTAQQVALAWQTASRALKLSHPPLYDELAAKVMGLLNERELVEPVTELLQLDAQVKKLEAGQKSFQSRLAELSKKSGEAQQRLEQLYQALATAVPQPIPEPEPQALALKRLELLLAQGPRPSAAGGRAAPAAAPVEGPVPSRAVLEAVVAGGRAFSREQREWCVAECLALTGWQFTPIELIERGDPWMAQQILAAPNAPA
jgi:hypothetical protein